MKFSYYWPNIRWSLVITDLISDKFSYYWPNILDKFKDFQKFNQISLEISNTISDEVLWLYKRYWDFASNSYFPTTISLRPDSDTLFI